VNYIEEIMAQADANKRGTAVERLGICKEKGVSNEALENN
jgi:hypothetical protein